MSLEAEPFKISQQPALHSLQHLQVITQAINDPLQRERAVKQALRLTPLQEVVGKFFGVKTSLAIVDAEDLPRNKRRVYEQGLDFYGKASSVSYYRNNDVPVDSLVIDFNSVHTMIDRADIEDEIDLSETIVEGCEMLSVRVPIMAIRACAIELPWAA